MEFNVTFNTIFYICVFIMAGILLRRFYNYLLKFEITINLIVYPRKPKVF